MSFWLFVGTFFNETSVDNILRLIFALHNSYEDCEYTNGQQRDMFVEYVFLNGLELRQELSNQGLKDVVGKEKGFLLRCILENFTSYIMSQWDTGHLKPCS